jgi:hypothetical protein
MITSSRLTYIGDRAEQLQEFSKYKTILDVGGRPDSSWTKGHATHYIDINLSGPNTFSGNLSLPYLWEEVLRYVANNGKFDYSVCTHVIEDLAGAKLVCDMLGRVSERGFVAVPSKYVECSRFEGSWRGFIHHRWILDVVGGRLMAWPKISYIERPEFDELASKHVYQQNSELQVMWEGSLDLGLVNNDYLGPDIPAVEKMYHDLLK